MRVAVETAVRSYQHQSRFRPHAFERFFRAKKTQKSEGLGSGMYITRLIVEEYGGPVWAESEVGKGSTFSFSLLAEQ